MRFVSCLVSLTLIGLCSTRAIGQTVEPGQKDGTAKESAIWKGIFADGTPLSQEKLKELLAPHLAWVRTANQKLEEEWGKAKVKGQDRETWTRELLASDWGADQGRLVLKGVHLSYANLKGEDLSYANLEGADLRNANLKGALYEPKLGRLPEIVSLRTAENLEMMRFGNFPHALEDLRREFKKVGFKEQERQSPTRSSVPNSLMRRHAAISSNPSSTMLFSIYPWPTAYVQNGRYAFLFR